MENADGVADSMFGIPNGIEELGGSICIIEVQGSKKRVRRKLNVEGRVSCLYVGKRARLEMLEYGWRITLTLAISLHDQLGLVANAYRASLLENTEARVGQDPRGAHVQQRFAK